MGQFVGKYVEDIKAVITAAVLSRQNAVLLGAPGEGKTSIAMAAVSAMLGETWTEPQPGRYVTGTHRGVFLGIEAGTMPVELLGPYNPQKLLSGEMVRATEGTVYHPATRIGIYDEIGRGNQAVFAAALQALNRPVNHQPIIATSNFMPTGQEEEAMLDRFALWLWVSPGSMDTGAVVEAQLSGLQNGVSICTADLPTLEAIDEVQKMTPGPKAIKAISELIGDLAATAAQQGYRPNKRRQTQWAKVLFGVGAWKSASADFPTLPDAAVRALRWAWPAPQPETAQTWAAIASEVVDPVGGLIETELANIFGKLEPLANMAKEQRLRAAMDLGAAVQGMEETLRATIGRDNADVEAAIDKARSWLSKAMMGEAIER